MTIDEIKEYCRIDGSDSDDEINKILLPAAKLYIENAVDNKEALTEDNPTYRLVLLLLINHWYNNRDVTEPRQIPERANALFHPLLMQLQNEPVVS